MGDEISDEQTADGRAAQALALNAAGRERADEFLAAQTHLTLMQIAREHREEHLRDWAQFVEYASAVLKLAFEFVVALIVLVIAVAIGAALWNASHDKGLVIEAFSVPPDLESRGLTGEVVAGKVLDRLTVLQAQTNSNRSASSYVNNWGNDIKVQIPETGVSIGQLYRYLVAWLGHQTHISGEIWRDASGLVVTARVAGAPAGTVHGPDAQLDDLIQQAAEAVYRTTQPYRYAVYADNHGRSAQATAIYRALIAGTSVQDRAWAYIGLAAQRGAAGDLAGGTALLRKAIAIAPDIPLIYNNLDNNENTLQHDELALTYIRMVVDLTQRSSAEGTGMGETDFRMTALQARNALAQALGDAQSAMRYNRQVEAEPDDNGSLANAQSAAIPLCAALHDRACFYAALDALPADTSPLVALNRDASRQQAELFFENYPAVIALSQRIIPPLKALGGAGQLFLLRGENVALAIAYAGTGDFKTARALIAPAPADCVVCLRGRAMVAALAHDWGAADYWDRREVQAAPSLPAPLTDWAQTLLWKGDAAGAVDKLAKAVALGPRNSDALELWGEALMVQNRSDLALAKFAASARLTPNWGRLHLKWGEALLWTGDSAGAHKQFALAAMLYLTPREAAALARLRSGHA
jgi:tetratricopeptide (TPR) repeat protein